MASQLLAVVADDGGRHDEQVGELEVVEADERDLVLEAPEGAQCADRVAVVAGEDRGGPPVRRQGEQLADHALGRVGGVGVEPDEVGVDLDAGERLPVHFHPGREFAHRHLGLDHGKTEAWIILEAEPGAKVHAGFAEDVDLDTVRGWMDAQDTAAMLAALRELAVAPGDAIFIPGGTPHAIGEGILLVELQEPEDLSINLEWSGFPLTSEGSNLGLGWDRALEALDRTAWDDERLASITHPGAAPSILGSEADPYFRAEHLEGGAPLDAGFSILVVTDGSGALRTAGGELALQRGSAVLVPHGAGEGELTGELTVLRSRPADPSSPEASEAVTSPPGEAR